MREPYKTDLTDLQWAAVAPLLPPAKHGGAPRTVDLREVVNTILYQAKTGCQWVSVRPTAWLPGRVAASGRAGLKRGLVGPGSGE